MKAAICDYVKPTTSDAAIARVGSSGGIAKYVSGSQSLGPMMNLRLAQPEILVDVGGIAALSECRIDGNVVTLGAGITHASIEDQRVETGTQGLMPFIARGIAYRAVRNRGTLGGSLAHADPAADWINTMSALDARFHVTGGAGERVISSADWMLGAFTTALAPDELLHSVSFNRLSARARWSYYKVNRKPGEFAEAIAILIDDSETAVCRAVIGAIDGAPHVISDARELLENADPEAPALLRHLEAAGLVPGTYEYQVHRVALSRAATIVRTTGRNAS